MAGNSLAKILCQGYSHSVASLVLQSLPDMANTLELYNNNNS